MRTACWITKATDTHSEYVILIAFRRQQWLRERASILRYTYIVYLVSIILPSTPRSSKLSHSFQFTINCHPTLRFCIDCGTNSALKFVQKAHGRGSVVVARFWTSHVWDRRDCVYGVEVSFAITREAPRYVTGLELRPSDTKVRGVGRQHGGRQRPFWRKLYVTCLSLGSGHLRQCDRVKQIGTGCKFICLRACSVCPVSQNRVSSVNRLKKFGGLESRRRQGISV
jgi:hypothetical protein